MKNLNRKHEIIHPVLQATQGPFEITSASIHIRINIRASEVVDGNYTSRKDIESCKSSLRYLGYN